MIEPKLTLPVKLQRKRKSRSGKQRLYVVLRELALLIVLLDLGNILYWTLAAYPIYRVVALIILVILWSNVASETARHKTKEAWDKLNTVSMQAVNGRRRPAIAVPNRSEDTTTYLVAMKKESYARIQTDRLHNMVPPEKERA